METLLIITVLIAILVGLALLWRAGGGKPPRKNSQAAKRRTLRDATAHPRGMPTPAPDAAPHPDLQADDPKETLRNQVRHHIHRIFPREGEPSVADFPHLSYRDIPKEITAELMAEVNALKNFRSAHRRLQKILNDPALQIGSELSKMVTSDPVLAVKILNTVNSPFYGMPQKIDSVGHAVLLLGIVRLREILYRNGLLKLFRTEDPVQNEIVENLWKHATVTSICASHLQGLYGDLDRGTLFTMGLLHDIGKLILLKRVGSERYQSLPSIHEEDARFGINHAIIGRMALQTWGFSERMVSVIERHHAPSICEARGLEMDEQSKRYLITLFFADQLAKLILKGEEAIDIRAFLPSYLPMIDRQRLLEASLDDVLLSSIKKSEVFAE